MYPSFEFGARRLCSLHPRFSVPRKYAHQNDPLNQGNLHELKLRLKIVRYLEIEVDAVQHSLIAHIHENVLRAQIAPLNFVLKSSNMRQTQKSTFSVKLTRIPFQCVLKCSTKYFISSKNISHPPF